jgi:hypothetical protein
MRGYIKNIFSNFLGIGSFFNMVKKACGKNSEVSSTRLTSFIITGMIILFCFYFLGIGTYIIIATSNAGVPLSVNIPNEMVIVFGSLLTHQLALLGINKYNETKQKITERKNKKVK